ncbi:MAG: hypothetical protein IKU11_08445, partial [Clostridia bacterium]|nr:hypothetical protein [Clostridia bacterium]
IVWYAGEDREIKLDQIQSAYAAIAISMDGTSMDETKVFLDEELISVTCGNLTAKASKRPQKNENWIYQA